MFGSDWPVSTQAATYEQVYEVAELISAPFSAGERAAFHLLRNPKVALKVAEAQQSSAEASPSSFQTMKPQPMRPVSAADCASVYSRCVQASSP